MDFKVCLAMPRSHSLDNASTNFTIYELERGPSDFDIRNNFQAALSYYIPGHYSTQLGIVCSTNLWSLHDTRISARSALPVDIFSRTTIDSASGQGQHFHPDRDLSQPLATYNPAWPRQDDESSPRAFQELDDANGNVIPRGNAGRSSARGLRCSAGRCDVGPETFHSQSELAFSSAPEAYNIFNHPTSAPSTTRWTTGGSSARRTQRSLANSGGLSSIYQLGGARSMQVNGGGGCTFLEAHTAQDSSTKPRRPWWRKASFRSHYESVNSLVSLCPDHRSYPGSILVFASDIELVVYSQPMAPLPRRSLACSCALEPLAQQEVEGTQR